MAKRKELKKGLKRVLLDYYWRAHDEELRRALAVLASSFDDWKQGQLSNEDLADRIHKFHNGVSREIYKRYDGKMLEFTVTRAIVEELLERSKIPAELLEYLKESLEAYETAGARS